MVGREQQRAQMTAGRIARKMNPPGVAAERLGVAMNPGYRFADLPHHFIERHARRERIFDRNEDRARARERQRREGPLILVRSAPSAAMDERQDRGSGLIRQVGIEALIGAGTVSDVEAGLETRPDELAFGRVAFAACGGVGYAELGIIEPGQFGGIVVAVGFHAEQSRAGRKERQSCGGEEAFLT